MDPARTYTPTPTAPQRRGRSRAVNHADVARAGAKDGHELRFSTLAAAADSAYHSAPKALSPSPLVWPLLVSWGYRRPVRRATTRDLHWGLADASRALVG